MMLIERLEKQDVADLLEAAKVRTTHDIGSAFLHVLMGKNGKISILLDPAEGPAKLFEML